MLTVITFPDKETESRALGMLIPRFSGKSWKTGETALADDALLFLKNNGINFSIVGTHPSIWE
jgi:hypothetical protein